MSEASKVELKAEMGRMTVLAGESTAQHITLTNLTALPDSFDLTVEGMPSGWYSFSSTSLNLFPNWSDVVTFKTEVSLKVRPNIYPARIIATSNSQPGVRNEIAIEIEVLAPLKVEARLQPRRGTGFKANYNLVLRNRSMCEGLMSLQLAPTTPYCLAHFAPPQIQVGAGKSETVNLKVQLRPKTPKEEARQPQPFEIQVAPLWYVKDGQVNTPEIVVEGEYRHRSRWAFLARHPFLYAALPILLLAVLLWIFLILPAIQGLMYVSAERITYKETDRNAIRVEQREFSNALQTGYNPLGAFVQVEAKFSEEPQSIELTLKSLFFSSKLKGRLSPAEAAKGNLVFIPDQAGQPLTFPWFFAPPGEVTKHLDLKLKQWGQSQNPRKQLTKAEIEGSTLFLRLRSCLVNDPTCG